MLSRWSLIATTTVETQRTQLNECSDVMTCSHGGRPAGQHVDQLYGARSLVSLSVPAARVQLTVLGVILAAYFNIDITRVISCSSQARRLTHIHSPLPSQYLAILH